MAFNSDIVVILILLYIYSTRQSDSKFSDFHWLAALLLRLADHFNIHGYWMLVIWTAKRVSIMNLFVGHFLAL